MRRQEGVVPLIVGMSVLLGCQFLGELVARGLAIPIPGPVLGMAILLLGLLINGRVPDALRRTGEGLLRHLTLLFVPAGVGIMRYFELIRSDFWTIAITLVVSTTATLAVTAKVLDRSSRNAREKK